MEWILGLAIAAVARFFEYLYKRWKASGRVNATEASEVWAEQRRVIRGLRRQIRDHEILDLERRIENHHWRNQVTTLHFANAGNVPEDLQKEIRAMGEAHIKELQRALEARRAEPINGNGGT